MMNEGEKMKVIERKYLSELIEYIGTPDIKVITGVRRSGKSKLLESFYEYLITNYHDSNVIYIDFNKLEFEDYLEYHKLYEFIKSKFEVDKNNFVLIDEVQNCVNFEKTINSLYSEGNHDIYLTGSNAFLLSSDLATLFTGRTIEIKITPFSYSEYMEYFNLKNKIECFDKYVLEGGLAGSYLYPTEKGKYDYIANVYETIIERDLVKRKKIRNMVLLKKIASFLMDNISNITSINNVTKTLNNKLMKINDKTVGSYIENLCQAYLFYKITRYDIKGKKYLASSEKYYLSDHAFKYALLGKKDMNYGRVYENMAALELLRRGYEVYVGVLYQKEIDFVAIKRNEKIYIQVSDDISNQDTFDREIESLLKIKDAYPKMLIARTKHPEYSHDGIKIIDIGEWLATIE